MRLLTTPYGGAMATAAPAGSDLPHLVDWDVAARTGVYWAKLGPQIGHTQAVEAVRDLRIAAAEAREHVRAHTGLDAPGGEDTVAVVDRATWIRANAAGLAALLAPVEGGLVGRASPTTRSLGSWVTGTEVGFALGWLSGKVLGQYEIYAGLDEPGAPRGKLLLNAPTIVAAEQELDVPSKDFRLWVCLHEETHRVQFTAVEWLRDHLVGEIRELLASAEPHSGQLFDALRQLADGARRDSSGDHAAEPFEGISLIDVMQSPEQRERLTRLTAVMSLLEGHADVVMDGVGPEVVPSVEIIRTRFQRRRTHPRRGEALIRRLLGLDSKLRQYRDGAAFVRAVIEADGMAGFNRVWSGPANLPTMEEIHDPEAWRRRVAMD